MDCRDSPQELTGAVSESEDRATQVRKRRGMNGDRDQAGDHAAMEGAFSSAVDHGLTLPRQWGPRTLWGPGTPVGTSRDVLPPLSLSPCHLSRQAAVNMKGTDDQKASNMTWCSFCEVLASLFLLSNLSSYKIIKCH